MLLERLLAHPAGTRAVALGVALHAADRHDEHLIGLEQLELHILLGRVELDDLGRTGRRLDRRVDLRRTRLEILVGLVLVAQAAHEPAAGARDLAGIEREILLLGHLDGDGLERAAHADAAQHLAAMADAAHGAGLVANAHLAHVDVDVEPRREVAHELAEVDALLGREVEDGVVSVEHVLHVDGLDIEVALLGELAEDRLGLLALLLQFRHLDEVLLGRDADDGAQRRAQLRGLLVGQLERLVLHGAERLSAIAADDDDVAPMGLAIAIGEPIRLGVMLESNGHYCRHTIPLLFRTTLPRGQVAVQHFWRCAPRRRRLPATRAG